MKRPGSKAATPPTADGEGVLYQRIRELVVAARQTVARGVDLVQVRTNFEIGRHIVEHEQQGEQRAAYGKAVLKVLADKLSEEFGSGFSETTLKLMRQFYLLYADRMGQTVSDFSLPSTIRQTVSGESGTADPVTTPASQRPFTLSWSHYVFLLGIKNTDERSFYEIEAASLSWTLRELKRQFDSGLYERLALSRDKEGIRKLACEGQIVSQPQDLLKEPLVLEFLGLAEQTRYSESDLETAIIDRLGQFLLELGKGFLFEARQKRFTFDDEHFFVDLVFYNRLLRCYVLIDLKLGMPAPPLVIPAQAGIQSLSNPLKGTSKNPSFPRMRESRVLIPLGSRIRGNDESGVIRGALKFMDFHLRGNDNRSVATR